MKNLAIIPARSGSKGFKDKNIYEINGKPLMAFTIEAALNSGCFDCVMVSTDSKRYADIAIKYGASVPFLRSEHSSSDTASSWDVVREVLNNYKDIGIEFDKVALLQPTSPLRDSDDIKEAFKLLDNGAINVTSVVEVEHPIQWCFELKEDLYLDEFSKSPFAYMRRQDLPKNYHENGAIYIVDAKKIENTNYNLYADKCKAYIMSNEKSIDIDKKSDLLALKTL